MTRSIAVLGRGFGLYGYAVAAHGLGIEVVTLRRYRDTILVRPEMASLADEFTFVETEEELVRRDVDALVYARDPTRQVDFVKRHLSRPAMHWLLEKPMTPVFSQRKQIRGLLSRRSGTYSVGYLFPFTPWFQKATEMLRAGSPGRSLQLAWSLPQVAANTQARNWKMDPSQGGGLLAYYAVHLAPLLHKVGAETYAVNFGAGPVLHILALTSGGGTLSASVSGGISRFEVSVVDSGGEPVWSQIDDTPFGPLASAWSMDQRVPFLQKYIAWALNDPITANEETFKYEVAGDALLD